MVHAVQLVGRSPQDGLLAYWVLQKLDQRQPLNPVLICWPLTTRIFGYRMIQEL
jgi:hypothetical protein